MIQSPETDALSRGLPERKYRPELHGVRGLAILGVVLFHLFGAGRISGGIDIFLAISGFLFTGMLLRESASSGGLINVWRYLARVVRRLVPPAALVIGVTLLAGHLLLPSTRREQLWSEARASLLYFENIELLNSQLAYGAAGPNTSPFQHFWSLSVQGQFYLVWPLVAIAAVLLARLLKKPAAAVMTVIVLGIIAVSFTFTLHMQAIDQDQAYLMTRTRFWELAFGGLLALVASTLVLPRWLRLPAGWVGILLIVSCGFILDGANLFPGPWALWPLAGLTLVMLSANGDSSLPGPRGSAAGFLSNSYFGWIGNIAYGLYLWHWPLLILYLEVGDRDSVGVAGAALVFSISLVLAWVTYRWLEGPVSRVRVRDKIQLTSAAAVMTIAGVSMSFVITQLAPDLPDGYAMSGIDREAHPGAAALEAGTGAGTDSDFIPDPTQLGASQPIYTSWGCNQTYKDEPGAEEVLVCEDREPPAEPSATVMLTGGSHSGHWYNALSLLADEYNWELIVVDKDGCRLRHTDNPEQDQCSAWNAGLQAVVAERQPDLVVASGTSLFRSGSSEEISKGAEDRWNEILETGSELLLIRGTARPDDSVPDCLAQGGTAESCGPDFDIYADQNPLDSVELERPFSTVDLTEYVCPEGSCPAVIGNVAVYRDNSHLSSHYVETLVPYLEEQVRAQLPELFD